MKKSILVAAFTLGAAAGAYASNTAAVVPGAGTGTVQTTVNTIKGAGTAAASLTTGGIAGSPHDLHDPTATTGVGTQTCVFCHTPHNANATVAAPLWSHALSSNTSWTPYFNPDFSTIQGNAVPGSVSQACLGCHDGSIALGYVANGAFRINGQAGLTANLNANDPGATNNDTATTTIMSDSMIGGGADLSTTHPIGISYPTSSNVFNAPSTFNNKAKLFIEGGGGATQIECASCHEPHNQGAQESRFFLRSTNDGSALCLTCHIK